MIPSHHLTPVLITGPTASGKSHIALTIAERFDGTVINADALQVYNGWRALTARPSDADEARRAHLLYGHVDWCTDDYSVGRWLADLRAVLDDCRQNSVRPVIVGGTGLYFTALIRGLADVPPIDPQVKADIEHFMTTVTIAESFRHLEHCDPDTAQHIDPRNPARISRALAVWKSTGKGLAAWRRAVPAPAPLIPRSSAIVCAIAPERGRQRQKIRARLDQMIDEGALAEARSALEHNPSRNAMKAIGAKRLIDYLQNGGALPEILDKIAIETGQYAKRQATWTRNQLKDWPIFDRAENAADYLQRQLGKSTA